jgi:hypothetical protein
MITMDTLNALCEEAGVDPCRVAKAIITPSRVTFQMYSWDCWGKLYLDKDRNPKMHYVIAKVVP